MFPPSSAFGVSEKAKAIKERLVKKHLLTQNKNFYKANLHCSTAASGSYFIDEILKQKTSLAACFLFYLFNFLNGISSRSMRVYHQHGIAVLYLITPLGVYQKLSQ